MAATTTAARIGFVTCVRLGAACIEEMLAAGAPLAMLMTLRDDVAPNKSGRVFLDDIAASHGIPLVKVRNINEAESLAAIREADLDWLFIIGWSQIARADVLSAPRLGALGIHPTLLPVGRGRASIPWAIIKALPETGVTLFRLDEGVDTGPILGQERLALAPDETATTLYARVVDAHRTLIRAHLSSLLDGSARAEAQDERHATVWPGRTPADGELRPDMTVGDVDRLVRGTTRPYPGAFLARDGDRVRVWAGHRADDAAPLSGALRLTFADGDYDAMEFDIERS
jgi:methionyl-tRNA formyltransferase